ncbi:MAG: hypothetical protein ACREP6_12505 [Candidatus Binataceae bacterium]
MSEPAPVLGLIRDLFFRSKLDAIAAQLGVEITYASSLEIASQRLRDSAPATVFVDLSDEAFPAAEAVETIKAAAPNTRVIGFASHVDMKALRGARDAGFSLTLSRSEFTVRLPELLK